MRKAKVCLAPLRFGAGLKGKLIDAMKKALEYDGPATVEIISDAMLI